ncbi:MAG: 3D domain-containing protein [Bacilli bacterium]
MKHTLSLPVAKLATGLSVCAVSMLAVPVNALAAALPPAPYTVQAGDTAYQLAALANVGMADFNRVNHFTASSTILAGERVAMPFLYRVDPGDTLRYIARRYRTTAAAIRQLNGLPDGRIFPTETLLLARGSVGASTWGRPATFPRMLSGAATTTAAASSNNGGAAFRMAATSYDGSAASNGHWGAVNYFGQPLQFGDVAVDPSVIPLGSRLFISGYNDPALPKGGFYATANDVGGAIQGNRIDIYLPTAAQANRFGVERVHVQVVSR